MITVPRTPAPLFFCTMLALAAGPACAHAGPHQMTWLQWLLHELADADTLSILMFLSVSSALAAWRLSRRKSSRIAL